jgi:hypothetical protein
MTARFMRPPMWRIVESLPLLALCAIMGAQVIAGDQQAAARVAAAPANGTRLPLKNDPPRFLFSEQPAILIPIDGDPVYRPIAGTDLRRIVNTEAFIVSDSADIHYLKVFDGWMEAYGLDGWSVAGVPPNGAERALQQAVAARTVDVLDGVTPGSPGNAPHLDDDTAPMIFIAEEPAELIVTDGPPHFAAVDGTPLEYIENTTASVFKEPTDEELYVLSAGRWFRAWTTDGPWEFVPNTELPADIAGLSDRSPKASVKASIAGTAQARAALETNAVPRTTTINRRTTLAPPVVDGNPKLQPIEGTGLSYVVNSPTPIVAVGSPAAYYAVADGVWFAGHAIGGPWTVASSVPAAIYTIPPSSPLHYVTYVRIYSATSDNVTVGYTPGYLGALVGDGVIVYGTGYAYPNWVGTSWWGRPTTYGLGAAMTYEPPGDWTYGFGSGWSADEHAWGWGVSPWSEPLGWGPRGERYPWEWRDGHAVRVAVAKDDGRSVDAWRVLPARGLYARWHSTP